MIGRRGCSLLLWVGVCFQAGCITLPWNSTQPSAAPPHEDPPLKTTAELPPEQAAEACLATAQALEKSGHIGDAIFEYGRARNFNPKLTNIAHRLAVLYQRQGDPERALAEYRLALQATPRNPDLLNDLGYFYYERGNWANAEQYLRQAIDLDAKHMRAWGNLGLTLGQQGRVPESYEAFAKVVSPAEAHSNVGVLLAQQGKIEEARAELQKAIELDPDLKQARVVLDRLESPPSSSVALASPQGIPASASTSPHPDRNSSDAP